MNNIPPVETLSNIIREEFAKRDSIVTSVYLFGSRTQGTAKSDSDWDFLIIIQEKILHSLQRKKNNIRN